MKVLVGLYVASMAILEYKYAGPSWADFVVSDASQIKDARIAFNTRDALVGTVVIDWQTDVSE